MVCDIGYKNVSRVTIPAPVPLNFKSRTSAPQVDADLLSKLGQDDPTFLEWFLELDSTPLQQQALQAALAASSSDGVRFFIKNGALAAEATYVKSSERKRIEAAAERVGRQWQIEMLRIVAQLLDFETEVTASGDTLTLEGEKHGRNEVHEYLRVTLDPKRGSAMLFEHFATKAELNSVRNKFLALAQKFGVRIDVDESQQRGSPILSGTVHKHHLKGGR